MSGRRRHYDSRYRCREYEHCAWPLSRDERSCIIGGLARTVPLQLMSMACSAQPVPTLGYSFAQVEGVIISSVVPPLMNVMENLCLQYLKRTPFIVGPGIKTGLNVRVDNPKEVGADRIVNAVAALELYGAPCIIVDFGTATTYDYIDPSAAAGRLCDCTWHRDFDRSFVSKGG